MTSTSPVTRTWCNYVLEYRTEYGQAAHKNRGYFSGQKTHRLTCQYVIAVVDEALELANRFPTVGKRFLKTRKPVLFSCQPACGCTQGQNAGAPVAGRTAADVTCEKCKSKS